MNPAPGHIGSFALSAALHLLVALALGAYATRPASDTLDVAPELDITSVELTLSEAETEAPGAPPQPTLAPIEPMPLPPDTQIEQLAPPEPQPLPEPPKPIEPELSAAPAPISPPEPPPLLEMESEVAINEPAARPPTPDFDELPEPSPQPEPPPPPAPIPIAESAGSPGGGVSGRVDGNPSLERTIKPDYPIGARRRGEEGSVVLDVTVAPSGRAARVVLVTSSGFSELDAAAERAAMQARFKPGKNKGRPVESTARLTLVFRLRDQ